MSSANSHTEVWFENLLSFCDLFCIDRLRIVLKKCELVWTVYINCLESRFKE